MKKIIGGIIAIFVIVMLAIVAIVTLSDGVWSTPWTPEPNSIGGEWGQEIIVGYKDGSNGSLKAIIDNPFSGLSVNVNGQEVSYFKYVLNAKATGQGYDSVNVDIRSYTIKWELESGGQVLNTCNSEFSGYPVAPIYVDSQWHILVSKTYVPPTLVPGDTPPGVYTLVLTPGGSLKYEQDGEWMNAELPDIISFDVEVVSGGWLEVSFSSGYQVS